MEEYINQLLLDNGVPASLDAEVRQQLVSDLSTRAGNMINRRLIDALTDEDAALFEKMIDSNPDDSATLQQFIDSHVPDKNQIVGATLLEFRALYLGDKA